MYQLWTPPVSNSRVRTERAGNLNQGGAKLGRSDSTDKWPHEFECLVWDCERWAPILVADNSPTDFRCSWAVGRPRRCYPSCHQTLQWVLFQYEKWYFVRKHHRSSTWSINQAQKYLNATFFHCGLLFHKVCCTAVLQEIASIKWLRRKELRSVE